MTILSFVAVFAGFGLGSSPDYLAAGVLVTGVFMGSALWWLLLSGGVGLFPVTGRFGWMQAGKPLIRLHHLRVRDLLTLNGVVPMIERETCKTPWSQTALTLPGYRVVRSVGVVRGITVRSRSIVGNIFGGLQSLVRRQHHHLHQPVRAGAL